MNITADSGSEPYAEKASSPLTLMSGLVLGLCLAFATGVVGTSWDQLPSGHGWAGPGVTAGPSPQPVFILTPPSPQHLVWLITDSPTQAAVLQEVLAIVESSIASVHLVQTLEDEEKYVRMHSLAVRELNALALSGGEPGSIRVLDLREIAP